jgi:hypothetical protein
MNKKLETILIYSALIGAIMTALAYLAAIWIMIMGIENTLSTEKRLLFSLIGAAVGIIINYLLREQGIKLASEEQASKDIMALYHKALNKTKKVKQLKTITHFRWWSLLQDIGIKGTLTMASTIGIIYIFIEGNGDWALILLATANLMLFAVFGILGMSKAYYKYVNEHLYVIQELTIKLNELALIPVEKEINEHKQCEVSVTTTTSGKEQKRDPGHIQDDNGEWSHSILFNSKH